MKYRVEVTGEVTVEVIVEARNEGEAKEKAEDALFAETYVGGQAGVLSNDDDVEVDLVDIDDVFNADSAEEEE